MKKLLLCLLLIVACTSMVVGAQRSISTNFESLTSTEDGWGFHWYLSRSSNPTAGYYTVEEPNEGNGYLTIVQAPSGTWNEFVPVRGNDVQLKNESGNVGSAYLVLNNDFNWHTAWYPNVDGVFTGSTTEHWATPTELEDAKNLARMVVSFAGHNGGSARKALFTAKKVPYSDYMVVGYMNPNRTDDWQELTIEDQTYYYVDEYADLFKTRLKDPNIPNWLMATDTTGPQGTETANIAIWRHLSSEDCEVIYDSPQNSGVSAFQIIAEQDSDDVPTLVGPADASVAQPIVSDLEWTAPVNGATGYDVYLGVYGDPNWNKAPVSENQLGTTFNPPVDLTYNARYIWKVDARTAGGTVPGDYWYFDVEGDPLITTQPWSSAAPVGGSTQFTVTSILTEDYAWYRSTDDASDTTDDDVLVQSGTSDTLIVSDVQEDPDVAYYYCVLTNTIPNSGPVTSDVVELALGKLEAYWTFDKDPNSVVGDWDGVVNDGGTVSYDEDGIFGKAIRTGNGYITVPGTEDYFNFYQLGLTVSCWVKEDIPYAATGGYFTIVAKGRWDTGNGWIIADRNLYSAGGPVTQLPPVSMANPGTSLGNPNPAFGGENWHFLTTVYNAALRKVDMFVDGILVQTNTGVPNPSSNTLPIAIGAGNNGSQLNPALIDDFKVYSYPMGEREIGTYYATVTGIDICTAPIPADMNNDCQVNMADFMIMVSDWMESTQSPSTSTHESPNRVVSWQFDEASGTTAADATGNGVTGNLGSGFTGTQWGSAGRTGLAGDGALYVDGSADMDVTATITDPNGLANGANNIFRGADSWTINVWVKLSAADMAIIGGFGDCEWDEGTTGQTDRYFAAYGDYAGYEFETGSDGFWPSQDLATDTWTMLTVTYDGTAQFGAAYLNGVQVSSKTIVLADTEEYSFKLNNAGAIIWGDYRTFLTGLIDDFTVYDGPLTATQVAGMYNSSVPCNGALTGDVNGDCVVDVKDFAAIGQQWLNCNLLPETSCSN